AWHWVRNRNAGAQIARQALRSPDIRIEPFVNLVFFCPTIASSTLRNRIHRKMHAMVVLDLQYVQVGQDCHGLLKQQAVAQLLTQLRGCLGNDFSGAGTGDGNVQGVTPDTPNT
ncbi:MAG: hypothetical protein V9H26_05650, partial [Verrucomicrobiota bacterium]